MPFADELLGQEAAEHLVAMVRLAAPEQPPSALTGASAALEGRTLRQRCDLLADALLADLPGDLAALDALIPRLLDAGLTGWAVWPVTEAVARRALESGGSADLDRGLELQALLTPRLTAEWGVRPLLSRALDRALPQLLRWTADPDPAVRRLASEGSRPYLPWGSRVQRILAEPELTIPILDRLYRDPDEVVRRSVANHLNDVSRHAPDLTVRTAQRWLDAPDRHTPRLVRHGLRTLIKRGNAEALALLGFRHDHTLQITGPVLDATEVPWAGSLGFTATVHNTGPRSMPVIVDYVLHFQKANGTLSAKTFKILTRTLSPDERLQIDRRHAFADLTTRRHHPGKHAIELQVNGVAHGRAGFVLGLR